MSKITKAKADAQAKLEEFLLAAKSHDIAAIHASSWRRIRDNRRKEMDRRWADFLVVEKYLK